MLLEAWYSINDLKDKILSLDIFNYLISLFMKSYKKGMLRRVVIGGNLIEQ